MRSIRATGSRQQHVAHAAMLPLLLLLLRFTCGQEQPRFVSHIANARSGVRPAESCCWPLGQLPWNLEPGLWDSSTPWTSWPCQMESPNGN